jgi:hypothetical protein
MPILYTATNQYSLAYVLDPGGYDSCKLPRRIAILALAEYSAIQYGLTEYFNMWNRELDTRQFNGVEKVATPAQETPRPLPWPVEIRFSNPICYQQLAYGRFSIDYKPLQHIHKMLKNISHKFTLIEYNENIARRYLQ